MFATWALQNKLLLRYYLKPPGVECASVIKNYNTDDDDWALRILAWNEVKTQEKLDKEWEKEYKEGNYWNVQLNERASLQGYATCFCLNEISTKREPRDKKYEVDTDDGVKEEPICEAYYSQVLKSTGWWVLFVKYIGYIVVGANFACRMLFIKIADLIGYTNETSYTEFIKWGIFVVYFCNTSILYLVAPWDSREIENGLLNTVF